ncbi:uncharacterized protein LOC135927117 [Gordionus sp. m RMFG-2023]|uniref:uncharacterized protein LOC135927117 n=1 Tax=Gordionus sp. m RMFG-2023 TaxID=3053472 RepID=UPI0031FD3EE3
MSRLDGTRLLSSDFSLLYTLKNVKLEIVLPIRSPVRHEIRDHNNNIIGKRHEHLGNFSPSLDSPLNQKSTSGCVKKNPKYYSLNGYGTPRDFHDDSSYDPILRMNIPDSLSSEGSRNERGMLHRESPVLYPKSAVKTGKNKDIGGFLFKKIKDQKRLNDTKNFDSRIGKEEKIISSHKFKGERMQVLTEDTPIHSFSNLVKMNANKNVVNQEESIQSTGSSRYFEALRKTKYKNDFVNNCPDSSQPGFRTSTDTDGNLSLISLSKSFVYSKNEDQNVFSNPNVRIGSYTRIHSPLFNENQCSSINNEMEIITNNVNAICNPSPDNKRYQAPKESQWKMFTRFMPTYHKDNNTHSDNKPGKRDKVDMVDYTKIDGAKKINHDIDDLEENKLNKKLETKFSFHRLINSAKSKGKDDQQQDNKGGGDAINIKPKKWQLRDKSKWNNKLKTKSLSSQDVNKIIVNDVSRYKSSIDINKIVSHQDEVSLIDNNLLCQAEAGEVCSAIHSSSNDSGRSSKSTNAKDESNSQSSSIERKPHGDNKSGVLASDHIPKLKASEIYPNRITHCYKSSSHLNEIRHDVDSICVDKGIIAKKNPPKFDHRFRPKILDSQHTRDYYREEHDQNRPNEDTGYSSHSEDANHMRTRAQTLFSVYQRSVFNDRRTMITSSSINSKQSSDTTASKNKRETMIAVQRNKKENLFDSIGEVRCGEHDKSFQQFTMEHKVQKDVRRSVGKSQGCQPSKCDKNYEYDAKNKYVNDRAINPYPLNNRHKLTAHQSKSCDNIYFVKSGNWILKKEENTYSSPDYKRKMFNTTNLKPEERAINYYDDRDTGRKDYSKLSTENQGGQGQKGMGEHGDDANYLSGQGSDSDIKSTASSLTSKFISNQFSYLYDSDIYEDIERMKKLEIALPHHKRGRVNGGAIFHHHRHHTRAKKPIRQHHHQNLKKQGIINQEGEEKKRLEMMTDNFERLDSADANDVLRRKPIVFEADCVNRWNNCEKPKSASIENKIRKGYGNFAKADSAVIDATSKSSIENSVQLCNDMEADIQKYRQLDKVLIQENWRSHSHECSEPRQKYKPNNQNLPYRLQNLPEERKDDKSEKSKINYRDKEVAKKARDFNKDILIASGQSPTHLQGNLENCSYLDKYPPTHFDTIEMCHQDNNISCGKRQIAGPRLGKSVNEVSNRSAQQEVFFSPPSHISSQNLLQNIPKDRHYTKELVNKFEMAVTSNNDFTGIPIMNRETNEFSPYRHMINGERADGTHFHNKHNSRYRGPFQEEYILEGKLGSYERENNDRGFQNTFRYQYPAGGISINSQPEREDIGHYMCRNENQIPRYQDRYFVNHEYSGRPPPSILIHPQYNQPPYLHNYYPSYNQTGGCYSDRHNVGTSNFPYVQPRHNVSDRHSSEQQSGKVGLSRPYYPHCGYNNNINYNVNSDRHFPLTSPLHLESARLLSQKHSDLSTHNNNFRHQHQQIVPQGNSYIGEGNEGYHSSYPDKYVNQMDTPYSQLRLNQVPNERYIDGGESVLEYVPSASNQMCHSQANFRPPSADKWNRKSSQSNWNVAEIRNANRAPVNRDFNNKIKKFQSQENLKLIVNPTKTIDHGYQQGGNFWKRMSWLEKSMLHKQMNMKNRPLPKEPQIITRDYRK